MSARRYGGAHSPGTREAGPGAPPVGQDAPRPWGGDRFRGRRAASIDVRGMLLFVLPLPLLFAAFSDIALGNVLAAVADLAALALLLGGAWMLREGQKAEAAFEARSVARRPAVPRKIIAAAAAGLGVAMPVSLAVTWLESRLEAERVAIETLTSTLLMQPAIAVDQAPAPMTGHQYAYAR